MNKIEGLKTYLYGIDLAQDICYPIRQIGYYSSTEDWVMTKSWRNRRIETERPPKGIIF